jgi:large subunit ribosomal protein L18
MNKDHHKQFIRQLRKGRVRAKISGTESMPRLSVFRSNSHIYAQIINDLTGKTLVSSSTITLKAKGNKSELATLVGKTIGEAAVAKGITVIVFDRGGYKYHGRVKALADAARSAGLKF